jgi:hypothetical protein
LWYPIKKAWPQPKRGIGFASGHPGPPALDHKNIFQLNIPHQDKVIKPKDMPLFNQNIKSAINKRNKLYKKTQAKTVSGLVAQAKQQYRTNLCNSLSSQSAGSKNYWLLIKKLLGTKFSTGISAVEGVNGLVDTDQNKAKLFLNKFLVKFKHSYDETVIPPCPRLCPPCILLLLTKKQLVKS